MKAGLKNYFSITKKEWNGLVVLVVVILVVLAAPYIYSLFRKEKAIDFKDFDKAAAQLSNAEHLQVSKNGNAGSDEKIPHPVMFPFDPNNLTAEQWEQLGLSGRQAATIAHYQAKGGKFYRPEDLRKIYAITADDYKRLEPYIQIPGKAYAPKKIRSGEIIELNGADSAKLTGLKGIGPSFAMRIIRYRRRLGGFYRKEQLKEVFGLDSIDYKAISAQVSADPAKVKKIPINTISFNQLREFPYLSYKQASAVIQYRVQHGPYKSITEMQNIVLLDGPTLHKIEPYINFR